MKNFVILFSLTILPGFATQAQVCNSVKDCNKLKAQADKRIAEIVSSREHSQAQVHFQGTNDKGASTTEAWVKCTQASGNEQSSLIEIKRNDSYDLKMAVPNRDLAVGTFNLDQDLDGSDVGGMSFSGTKPCSVSIVANDTHDIHGTFSCVRTLSGGLSMGDRPPVEVNMTGTFSCIKKNYCTEDYTVGTLKYNQCIQSESN